MKRQASSFGSTWSQSRNREFRRPQASNIGIETKEHFMKKSLSKLGIAVALTLCLFIPVSNLHAQFGQVGEVGQGRPLYRVELANYEAIAAGQHCSQWCWAAGCQMLAKSQGIDVLQERFVEKIFGPNLPCLPSGAASPDVLLPIAQAITGTYIANNGQLVQLTAAYHLGIPTDVGGMIRSISEGRPFIFAWQGHAYVAWGINFFFTGPNTLQITQIDLIDPLFLYGRPKFTSFVVGVHNFQEINGTVELIVLDNDADPPAGGIVLGGDTLPVYILLPGGGNNPGILQLPNGAILPGVGFVPNIGVVPGNAVPNGILLPGDLFIPDRDPQGNALAVDPQGNVAPGGMQGNAAPAHAGRRCQPGGPRAGGKPKRHCQAEQSFWSAGNQSDCNSE